MARDTKQLVVGRRRVAVSNLDDHIAQFQLQQGTLEFRVRRLPSGNIVEVDERARGQGIGTQLLTAAEDLARSRGCIGASLDTFEYQARPFYEKLGYKLFGTLDGFPPGSRQFYLSKPLR